MSRVHLNSAVHEHWSREGSGPGHLPAAPLRSAAPSGAGKTNTSHHCAAAAEAVVPAPLGAAVSQGELCFRLIVSES